jgi:hypothetical protein
MYQKLPASVLAPAVRLSYPANAGSHIILISAAELPGTLPDGDQEGDALAM